MDQILHNAFFLIIIVSIFSSKPHGRDLRPSEHGLPSSYPTEKSTDPQLHSFFAGSGDKTPSSLPEARNLTWWDNSGDQMSHEGNQKDHVREALLVSSLVCGAAGVVLLAVSAAVFVVRLRKRTSQREMSLSTLGSTSLPNVVNK
ncbi:uncharacterized protein LOC129873920 [Solanum dulcamara]|uniref:uncharacterized protein LOC129873920 n=1 Tax=Solanum dulcamara TaxID=45834 RepID=UPI002486651F|nr:uncharacterized protein LOC129873920 [Solanum dulcamara]